jgi:serine/threonine protein kinase
MANPDVNAPPRLIAERYEVLAELGRGGMGLVAHAFDHRLETEVALKILRRDLTGDAAQTESLVKEARILARLTHPSIVRLFDLAETQFGLMLILEYVRGPNLAQVLKARSRLTETELLFIMRQICSGLDAAHAEGIIHRDLKPPNLLVATDSHSFESFKKGICTSSFLLEGKVKITDFGISKLLAARAEVSSGAATGDHTWSSAGTPAFMSPEQFQGLPSTPETDIYALGIVAYQVLTGRLPFVADSVHALAVKHISEAPEPITDCSPRINRAILRAMSKRPEDRFSSARAFLASLEGSDETPVVSPDEQPTSPRSYILPLSIACGVLFVLVVVAIAYLARSPMHPNQVSQYSLSQAKLPDFGKRITLPEDMDVLPEINSLPAPSSLPSAPPLLPGPRKPHISWTALIDEDSELDPWVDGVGPDGIIYVRDDTLHTLWVIQDGVLRWAYRASKQQAGVDSLIDRASHADFRDPGRIWFAWCPDDVWHPRSRCSGTVFNSTGAGGHINRLAAGVGLTQAAPDITRSFSETDAPNSRWPEDNPSLYSTSHLGTVTLSNRAKHWKLPLDGRAVLAIDHRDGFIVSTSNGAIYALDNAGQMQWMYKTAEAPSNLQLMPSGDLVILEKGRQTLSCVRAGKLRWQYHSADPIDEFEDHVAGTRRLAVADKDSTLYVLTSAGTSATLAIDREGKLLWTLPWGGYINSGSLTLDSRGRLFFTFALYEINHRSRGGVICISNG